MITWEEYENRFRWAVSRADARRRFDRDYTDRCLRYAQPLFAQGLPIIYDNAHFAYLVGYQRDYVLGVSNAARNYYRTFYIPKKSGGVRAIVEPLPSLKEIQRWILDNVLGTLPIHQFAKGFVKERSIRDNAKFHQRQLLVLTVDIENFFGNISAASVLSVFLRLGYSSPLAVLLTHLCTLDGSLPQGAPTSPVLSNLACTKLDVRLAGYARKLGIRYTRYADDLTFSGQLKPGKLIEFVVRVLRDYGFSLNESKTKLMHRHQRQETTGVVVNQKLQVPREIRRKIRQECWYIEKFGLDSHLQRIGNRRANYVKHILGIVGYILFVNPIDADGLKAHRLLVPLLHRNL